MPRKGQSDKKIVFALRQVESGKQIGRYLPRDGGFAADLLHMEEAVRGRGVSELDELRQLREENRKLKTLVADLTLDKHILQEVLSKRSKALCSASTGAARARSLQPQ